MDLPAKPPEVVQSSSEEIFPFWGQLVLAGPILLGLSLGMQLMMSAMFLWGPKTTKVVSQEFTNLAKDLIKPEHDLLIYVLGIAVSIAMAMGAIAIWRRSVKAQAANQQKLYMLAAAVLQVVIALGSMAMYLMVLSSRFPFIDADSVRQASNWPSAFVIFVPTLLGGFCAVWDMLRWGSPKTSIYAPKAWPFSTLDLIMPVLIILMLFIPSGLWADLAGQCLSKDNLHHWNYFHMGPALLFAHGGAFETDFYSQYGIGWPFLAVLLKPILPLTYANAVGMAIIYACIYYCGLYLLLRLLLKKNIVFAVIGLLLAIYWQMFSGMHRDTFIWMYPSSTVLRHPMDVWFFLALLLHTRHGKTFLLTMAGASCGLGVFFETDTGIYLFATAIGYGLLRWLQDHAFPIGQRKTLYYVKPVAIFAVGAIVVALPLLYFASRGTVFSAPFWSGLMHSIGDYAGSGVGMLPLASLDDQSLLLFLFMVGLYLSVICLTLVQCLQQKANAQSILVASVSLYGLALLLVFVGRSHPFNLYHPMVPFAVVLSAGLYYGWQNLQPMMKRSILPSGLAVAILVLLFSKPTFVSYPSLLNVVFSKPPISGLMLAENPSDLSVPHDWADSVGVMRFLARELHTLSAQGEVAILEKDDTVLYYLADVKPWSRYSPLCTQITTKKLLHQILDDLNHHSPRYAVILSDINDVDEALRDTWQEFHRFLEEKYTILGTIGPYAVFQLRQ